MGILDELREQTRHHGPGRPPHAAPTSPDRPALVAPFRRIYLYLHQLIEQLAMLEPEVLADFPVLPGRYLRFRQGDYDLLAESHARLEMISLMCGLRPQLPLELSPGLDAETEIDRLKELGLYPEPVGAIAGNRFALRGYLPARFEFKANFDARLIELTVANFHRPGAAVYQLAPDAIDEVFLDRFARYLLRRNGQLPSGAQPGEPGEGDQIAEEPIGQTAGGRVRARHAPGRHLELMYGNATRALPALMREFVLGRGPQCHLVVASGAASRLHARILYRMGAFVLIDHSATGTFVRPHGGEAICLKGEELPLSGCGTISLGRAIDADPIHYRCGG